MPKLTINGQEITVEDGLTVLQACEQLGVEVPIFCYHPKLSIAGNCRMCLVEMEKSAKPIASCAMPASEGMVIKTDTPMVHKAREGALEFLLINHPLDCPICDQGGECDLQDITLNYGRGNSRFSLNKRAVPEKNMGPLIKTAMTRCIHCTRCVRFASEIAGVPEMGAINRGEHMEITSYLNQAVTSELSGNMIDICPVGALTSKPYAFHGRSWELVKTESVDVLDAVGSHIRIDVRGREVMRILPVLCEDINEEWISDRTRFAYDGLKNQRLQTPYVKIKGKLEPCTWDMAFKIITSKIQSTPPHEIAAIAGDLVDCESVMALKDLMDALGSPHLDCRQDGAAISTNHRSHYLFNTGIANLEEADVVLLIGTNPRAEAPMINARLRKRYLSHGDKVGVIGPNKDLTYPCENLGDHPKVLEEILSKKHPFSKVLSKAKKPVLIIGQSALRRPDAQRILSLAQEIAQTFGFIKKGWNGFNILHTAASRVGALDLGFIPGKNGYDRNKIFEKAQKGVVSVVYLLGADEIPMNQLGQSFVIYQGHHGDAGAHRADIILPGCAYPEKNALYVNTEGRVQKAFQALHAPGDAKEDWRIIRALSEFVLDRPLPYDNQEELRARMAKKNPCFKTFYEKPQAEWTPMNFPKDLPQWSDEPLQEVIENFYMTDPITRHSKTMAHCTQEILKQRKTCQ